MIDTDYFTSKLYKNKYTIFLFHGVINRSDTEIRNYTNKHIQENVFEKCIDNLKKNANPLSMHDVLQIYEKILLIFYLNTVVFSIRLVMVTQLQITDLELEQGLVVLLM